MKNKKRKKVEKKKKKVGKVGLMWFPILKNIFGIFETLCPFYMFNVCLKKKKVCSLYKNWVILFSSKTKINVGVLPEIENDRKRQPWAAETTTSMSNDGKKQDLKEDKKT